MPYKTISKAKRDRIIKHLKDGRSYKWIENEEGTSSKTIARIKLEEKIEVKRFKKRSRMKLENREYMKEHGDPFVYTPRMNAMSYVNVDDRESWVRTIQKHGDPRRKTKFKKWIRRVIV